MQAINNFNKYCINLKKTNDFNQEMKLFEYCSEGKHTLSLT